MPKVLKGKTETIIDPHFGPIELPIEKPMSEREAKRLRLRIRESLLRQRRYRTGTDYRCVECGTKEVRAAGDLTAEFKLASNLIIFRNLQGARCDACGVEYLEASELVRIEDEVDQNVPG